MKNLKSLSAFLLCFNDAPTIARLVDQLYYLLPKITNNFEVFVVDDGSTDNSDKVLQNLKKTYPDFKIVRHRQNRGYGAAIISGFKKATKNWVFYTDGDGQYSLQELQLLADKVDTSIGAVNGYKLNRADSYLRKISGRFYNWLLHRIYPVPIRDLDCDFRLIKKSLLNNINLRKTSGVICLELIMKLHKSGVNFAQVGIHHYPRLYGQSQFFRFKHLWKTFLEQLQFYGEWSRLK